MMSSAVAQRAGRAPKDKNKPQPSHTAAKATTPKAVPTETAKTSEGMVAKIQPTAEQLRIAQIINDANKSDYPDLKDKVERIIEITGQTSDAALVALHDCDNDSNRAAIMLLEGNQDEGKWETSGKKKKNRQSSQQKTPEVNGHEPTPVETKEEKETPENNRRREPQKRDGGGSYRYRGPPRLNRGGQGRNWTNKENEKNERFNQDRLNQPKRERNGDIRGRPRGGRNNFVSGRGRGRGGRSRTFQNRVLQSNDGFPESIDTWQNSTAEKTNNSANSGDATMTVGNWSDVAVTEEWSEEDWTENLTETKVFTPSAATQQSAVTGLDIPASVTVGQNIDLTSFLQKSSTNTENGPSTLAANAVSAQSQSNLMLQQTVAPQSQSHFDFTQFAKQAEAQIKAAVGVVSQPTPAATQNTYQSNSATYPSSYTLNSANSSSSQQHHVQQMSHDLQQVIVSQSSYPQGSQQTRDLQQPTIVQQQPPSVTTATKAPAVAQQQGLPQRVKPAKARLPPPSKIPESAVVMPDDAVPSLDVSFGALQFGTDPSPFDFGATAESNNTYQDMNQNTNGTSHVNSQSLPVSISSQSYSNPLPPPVTSMSKESSYSIGPHSSPGQNSISTDLSQSQKVASQESMLLQQSEHNSVENVSSYVSHRNNQNSSLDATMLSSKSTDQSSLSFSAPSHDPTPYASYSSQKMAPSSTLAQSTYSHSQAASDLATNQQVQSKFQTQTASQYGSTSSYGLQQSPYVSAATTSGNVYPSQTGYNSHSTASYGSNNSGYNSQQNVYSGSAVTSTQGGSMISTSVSSSKLPNSLSHGVKDSSLLESQHSSSQHTYEVASTTSSSSVLSTTSLQSVSSTNHSAQNSSNMNSVLGLVSTSSSTTTTSVLKNSLSATGKTVPNISQNIPAAMMGHQYFMGQPTSVPYFQPAMYSYEDMQMLSQKLSTMGVPCPAYTYEDLQILQSKMSNLGYYDMQYQAPTSMTGRDPGMGSVGYTADGKFSSRAETDASTVSTTLSQQGQANTQAHGQAFLNHTLPPGYGYYFTGGMMTGGIAHHYAAPPMFPVPPATNTHGATTNTQFQKANAYGSHSYSSGYDSLSQTQDYSKGSYGAASQNQVKGVSGSGPVPDLSGSVYSKTHAQQLAKFNDKPGFHTGTPPPFNQAAGPLGASSAPYAAQFIPVLAHGQHHSTAALLHHMQQDAAVGQGGGGTGNPTAGQRGMGGQQQQKAASKQNYAYWAN